MAGDWIPARIGLSKAREVVAISAATGRTRQEVCGWLLEFWSWASCETRDGHLPGMTVNMLAQAVGPDCDFYLAVIQAGWLSQRANGLVIPNFDNWLGRSAKSRLENTVRQRLSRSCRAESVTTEQNNTEQNNTATTTSTVGAVDGALVKELTDRGLGLRRAEAAVASDASLVRSVVLYFDAERKRGALKNPVAALKSMLTDPEGKWEFERGAGGAWKPPSSGASAPTSESIAELTQRRRAQAEAERAGAVRGLKGGSHGR